MKIDQLNESKLSYFTDIKTNFKDADFWIIRRGSADKVGKPVKEYDSESIGIKVTDTNKILPDYLYYWFYHIWQQGHWKQLATGTTNLVNISTSDIKQLSVSFK